MHDFGKISLVGLHGVFKARQFQQPNADRKTRTFVCESGPGCNASENKDGSFDGRKRTVRGHWLIDNMPDTVNSYDFECVVVDGKDVLPRDAGGEYSVDTTPVLFTPESVTPAGVTKPRGRSAWKPMEPVSTGDVVVGDETPKTPVGEKAPKAVVGHRHPAPPQDAPVNGTLVTAAEGGLDLKAKEAAEQIASDAVAYAVEPFSPERAVALYQGGMKVSDIAARFGDRNKQNRVRKACKDAGVYQGK
jgi:hypothetical protein